VLGYLASLGCGSNSLSRITAETAAWVAKRSMGATAPVRGPGGFAEIRIIFFLLTSDVHNVNLAAL
jgi:hypothetical protein